MYWLDNNTGILTAPTIPPVISAAKRYFTNGGSGVQPSVPEDFWFNMVTEELLGVLDMAGIAPDKDDLGQLAKAIQSIAFSAYPVGAPIPWPLAVPPTGFLAMNGQSFNIGAYPNLALAYPSGVLPDLRAEFIRGWDSGRGIDSGRALLSSQSDAGRRLQGSVEIGDNYRQTISNQVGVFGASTLTLTTAINTGPVGVLQNTKLTFDSQTVLPSNTASEFRARNISFFYIVRAI